MLKFILKKLAVFVQIVFFGFLSGFASMMSGPVEPYLPHPAFQIFIGYLVYLYVPLFIFLSHKMYGLEDVPRKLAYTYYAVNAFAFISMTLTLNVLLYSLSV